MGARRVIPLPHRQKGGAPQVGAKGPGQTGPFGPYGTDEDDLDEDDHQDGGQQAGPRTEEGHPSWQLR
jgi:hypothetical protein